MMIIPILCLSALDVTLTHYQIFCAIKKDVFVPQMEINLIPRLIIGKNPNALRYLMGTAFSLSGFAMLFYFILSKGVIPAYFGGGVMIGALFLINYIHIHNIVYIRNNWNNEAYWILKRQQRKVEIQ